MANIYVPKIGNENPRTANLYRPFSQIEIHTQNGTFGPGQDVDPSNSLMQWQYSKQLSASDSSDDIGQLTLNLTAGPPTKFSTSTWLDLISPMDLIVVYASKSGRSSSDMRTRFIGYITDIYEVVDTESNPTQPQRYIQILAQDLMMGLDTSIVFPTIALSYIKQDSDYRKINNLLSNVLGLDVSTFGNQIASGSIPLLSFLGSELNKSMSLNQLLLMDPSTATNLVLEKILSVVFSPQVQISSFRFSGTAGYIPTKSGAGLVTQAFDNTSQFAGAQYFVQPQEETFYAMFQGMMNAPFLEFFGDVRSSDQMGGIPSPYNGSPSGIAFGPDNATFQMVIRNTPFDTTSGAPGTSSNAFEQLPMTDVMLKDSSGKQWGKSMEDVVNYYYVYPEGFVQQGGAMIPVVNQLYGALLDADSITQYGLQPLEVPILGWPQDSNDAMNPVAVKKFEQALYDWYHLNPQFIRGTTTIHGDPSVRVGQRIRFPTVGLIGYVESLTETYTAMQSYESQVTFSRGVYAS
ncbi:hypothetical protein [Alicyclobacillus fastidiosus]|uniref:Uncharacterized protein n=1 Tax=Alicyclobacillus fastidiosus TaxID=392011 RepID=A0ABV5AL33_9BACL